MNGYTINYKNRVFVLQDVQVRELLKITEAEKFNSNLEIKLKDNSIIKGTVISYRTTKVLMPSHEDIPIEFTIKTEKGEDAALDFTNIISINEI